MENKNASEKLKQEITSCLNFKVVEIPGSHVVTTMDTCLHSINRAMEIMGAYGANRMWDVEKHWRDIKMGQLYEGGTSSPRWILQGITLIARPFRRA